MSTRKPTDQITLLHGAVLNSRIALSPMLTFSGLEGGFASDETIDYYRARSQAGALLVAEYHYVSETGGPCSPVGFPEQLGVYSDAHTDSIRRIAQALKKDGNKAVLQIHHGGREAYGRGAKGLEVLAPSAIDYPFLPYKVREMTDAEIRDIIKDFGRAAKRAIDAGFDGVEIHGANHYAIQQFFSAYSNRRSDFWGGTLEKRMNFALEIVKEVKAVVAEYAPQDFIVGYRLSPEEIHGDTVGYTYRESLQLVREIVKHEPDYIHLSLWGNYDSKPQGADKSYAELFRSVLDEDTKLMIVGSVFDEKAATDAIARYTDLLAVGRGTLVDPEFGRKIAEGKGDTIVSEISPEQLARTHWTTGLTEVFTDPDRKVPLPPLPNQASIQHLYRGLFEKK